MTARPQPAHGGNDLLVIGAVVVAVIGLLWFFGFSSDRGLARGATGFDGLVTWLEENDVEARAFHGSGSLTRDNVKLRVLPLYDVDLREPLVFPESPQEVIEQRTETDFTEWVLEEKTRLLDTLVILPKWRKGMRLLGVAHQTQLIPVADLDRLLIQMGFGGARVVRDPDGVSQTTHAFDDAPHDIALLHAQTVRLPGCDPVVGTQNSMLIGSCTGSDGQTFWVLSDPDLMSNHGLALGGNAAAALDLVRMFADDGPVIVDWTDDIYTIDQSLMEEYRERTWDDFFRLFSWPFTVLWIGFAVVGGLVLWRALVRYGPLARMYRDEPRASKTVSINAKARLLRLSRHDGALLESHIRARLNALAAELLGPSRQADMPALDSLTRLIARRDPELAEALAEASRPIGRDGADHGDLSLRLDRFETCYDKVRHEFGRTADAG